MHTHKGRRELHWFRICNTWRWWYIILEQFITSGVTDTHLFLSQQNMTALVMTPFSSPCIVPAKRAPDKQVRYIAFHTFLPPLTNTRPPFIPLPAWEKKKGKGCIVRGKYFYLPTYPCPRCKDSTQPRGAALSLLSRWMSWFARVGENYSWTGMKASHAFLSKRLAAFAHTTQRFGILTDLAVEVGCLLL